MKKGINSAAITCTFQTSKQEHFVVKSQLASVHGLPFEHACIARHRLLFTCAVSKMKQRQQIMMFFLSTADKSQRQSGNKGFKNYS